MLNKSLSMKFVLSGQCWHLTGDSLARSTTTKALNGKDLNYFEIVILPVGMHVHIFDEIFFPIYLKHKQEKKIQN